MAMSTCRECQRPVSTAAESCPECGAVAPTGRARATRLASLVVAGVLIAVILVAALYVLD